MLESVESVDMMRAVEHGYRVRVVETRGRMIGVDVPADIKRAEELLLLDPLTGKYMESRGPRAPLRTISK